MKYFLITNNPMYSKIVIQNNVDYIFIDMETLGKEKRQMERNAVFSNHTIKDIATLSQNILNKNILVRVNPINENSEQEIESVLQFKPAHIMLPFFKKMNEVQKFSDYIRNESSRYLLVETIDALDLLPEIINKKTYDGLHLGLNDLSIEMCYKCVFKVLFDKRFLKAIKFLNNKKIPFGIGGVGKIGIHKIPAEMLLTQYMFLGSQAVILSRAFNSPEIWMNNGRLFTTELNKIKQLIKEIKTYTNHQFEENQSNLQKILGNLT